MGEGWMETVTVDGHRYVREFHAVSYDGGGTNYSDYKFMCVECNAQAMKDAKNVKHKMDCSARRDPR